ncbi:MAG: hypothetical protein ACRC0S_09180 [Fusobacteriaceae bacterium]
MLDLMIKNTGKFTKMLVGIGFVSGTLLLGGCFSKNNSDTANTEAIVEELVEVSSPAAAIKITESNNKTELEKMKTVDVNKSEELKMQLEIKKLELIEAQKLKNEHEIEKLNLENASSEKKSQANAAAAKTRATAAAKEAKEARAEEAAARERAAKARAEREEIEILKSIAE